MTKEELLNGLEGLKDMLNDGGKNQINTFKAAIREMVPDDAADQPDAQTVPPGFMGRRNAADDSRRDR